MKTSGLENQFPNSACSDRRIERTLRRPWFSWKSEVVALLALITLVIYFLTLSWRKWSDPLIDGYVWYNSWLLSNGATLYHDVHSYYGPLVQYFDGFLFRIFGPGMMVLLTANLVLYVIILGLVYFTFRQAWGRLGAFAASSVFISIFSFSQLQQCGNFNFIAPYSHEIIYGTLLTLIATIIAARWCRAKSVLFAWLLGFCAGLATVLKPEFMLACGFLGGGVFFVRWFCKKPLSVSEFAFTGIGLVIPTLIFTICFAQTRPWKIAFIDASQAWWQVVAAHANTGNALQQNATGLNDPWVNGFAELAATASAILVLACIWAIGWIFNRPWPIVKRVVAMLAAAGLIYAIGFGGDWLEVGLCLPGLVAVLFFLIIRQLRRERRDENQTNQSTVMAFMLVLVAASMLARMLLQARIYDFGFFQAAFAGMVVAAAIVTYIPQWTGPGWWGHRLAIGGCAALLTLACISIALDSRRVRLAQTQPVGSGLDRFYAFNPTFDSTGALVNWVIENLNSIPPQATVLGLPEGAMINYLSRHKHPLPSWVPIDGGSTMEEVEEIVNQLRKSPPDYVVLISRSMKEHGLKQFGAPGTPGEKTLQWIIDNYQTIASQGGDPFDPKEKGAVILKRK